MIIVLRIANPYIILRQITNLPQLRTSAATGDVDIIAACQHVVQAAESDIITPAVTAEDLLAALGQMVLVGEFAFVIKKVCNAIISIGSRYYR